MRRQCQLGKHGALVALNALLVQLEPGNILGAEWTIGSRVITGAHQNNLPSVTNHTLKNLIKVEGSRDHHVAEFLRTRLRHFRVQKLLARELVLHPQRKEGKPEAWQRSVGEGPASFAVASSSRRPKMCIIQRPLMTSTAVCDSPSRLLTTSCL